MLNKQAKVLSQSQLHALQHHLKTTRHPERNRVALLLSVRAGLRAKEISELTWSMITDSEGQVSDVIRLPNSASKGNSGGIIPIAKELKTALLAWKSVATDKFPPARVFQSERSKASSAQVIVNLFAEWYLALGFEGCSSHSGRRTFITQAARNIGRFGGSLRDVQQLARHSSLAMTQRYIEVDTEAMRKVVDW